MKFIFTVICGLTLACGCFASGIIPPNQAQSGVINFNVGTGLVQTNTFPYPYQSLPAVLLFPSATNNTPLTLSGITTSGFVVTVTTGATTNLSVAWQAYAGFPRVYAGTNIMAANVTATNVFPVPYILPPIPEIADSSTNGGAACVVTTTNIVITTTAAETVFWGTFGVTYQPGLNTVTY